LATWLLGYPRNKATNKYNTVSHTAHKLSRKTSIQLRAEIEKESEVESESEAESDPKAAADHRQG